MIQIPTTIKFPTPITLSLRLSDGPRCRLEAPDLYDTEFEEMSLYVQADCAARELRAYLSPIPAALILYRSEDFAAACGDTMEDHAAHVLRLLGSDPEATLQALIDGSELPPPPQRVPREIPNWRAKAVLDRMGLLSAVETFLASLPEPQRTDAKYAWKGDAKMARQSATVSALAAALNLSAAQIDAMFIAAEAIDI